MIKCITFAKMETWKPDTVGKVQEFYTGRVCFPISVCHQRGKASAQAVKIPQELPQTNLQTSQVKPVLNITGHLESRHMLAFVFVFCVFPLYFWLCWVFVGAHWLSRVAASEGHSLVVVRGLLIAVAAPVAEYSL